MTDSTVLMSVVMIVWHKVCFGSKCSQTNGENVGKTLASDVALKTI